MDTGLQSLLIIAKLQSIAAEQSQLLHEFGVPGEPFGDVQILRAAKSLNLKAKLVRPKLNEIVDRVLPSIVKLKNGDYCVLARTTVDNPSRGEVAKEASRRFLIFLVNENVTRELDENSFCDLWSGDLIALAKRPFLNEAISRKFELSWFLPSLKKYKKLFIEVLIASFFLQIFALITPIFFQVVMDKVLVHDAISTLNVLAVGFFFVIVFESVLGGLRNYLFSHTTNRVDVELGARLYNHLMALPLAYFEARQIGQSVARVRELDSLRNFITGTALTLLIDFSFLFVFLGVMWFYSPQLTILVLGSIPMYAILSAVITPSLKRRLDEKFRHGAANTSFLTESLTGITTVKAMAVEPQMQRRLEDHLSRYVNASFRSQNLNNIASQIAGFISKLVTLGIIWYGAHLVMDSSITVGQLIAFNMFAGRISTPILKLVQLWQDFQQAGISLNRLGDILNSPREPGSGSSTSPLRIVNGAIEFRDVSFQYMAGGQNVLNHIDIQIKPGEVIGIVGRSGSGKSTITKLIQRFYVPQTGKVLIDGADVSLMDCRWLRRNIGVVLQESFLFNRTIRENISLIDPSLSMDAVSYAAKLAGAHDFISELPHGYDTILSENGTNLSGGQKQRIAIARALVGNPKILIFDEATSALDYESESVIQRNMHQIAKGRTVLIIAHRLRAVRDADQILVMDKGAIVERGSHDLLIQKNGVYAQLYRLQDGATPTPTGAVNFFSRNPFSTSG